MKPSNNVQFMSEVSKDIIGIKMDVAKSIRWHFKEFHAVMEKHGIKQNTRTGKGMGGTNFEWTICQELFLTNLNRKMVIEVIFGRLSPPAELKAY